MRYRPSCARVVHVWLLNKLANFNLTVCRIRGEIRLDFQNVSRIHAAPETRRDANTNHICRDTKVIEHIRVSDFCFLETNEKQKFWKRKCSTGAIDCFVGHCFCVKNNDIGHRRRRCQHEDAIIAQNIHRNGWFDRRLHTNWSTTFGNFGIGMRDAPQGQK